MLSPNEALDVPDAARKMVGSFMIWECENYAAAIKMLEEDPYWSGDVVRNDIPSYSPLYPHGALSHA